MKLPIRSSLAILLCAIVVPSHAEGLAISASSAGSSASSAGSASLRGSSDSISSSSNSSRNDRAVLEGEYRVTRVDKPEGRPDMLRVTMAPLAQGGAVEAFRLDLPQRALGVRPLRVGDTVEARHRPYGIQFARADTREPFFLVVQDDWQQDLQTRVLTR